MFPLPLRSRSTATRVEKDRVTIWSAAGRYVRFDKHPQLGNWQITPPDFCRAEGIVLRFLNRNLPSNMVPRRVAPVDFRSGERSEQLDDPAWLGPLPYCPRSTADESSQTAPQDLEILCVQESDPKQTWSRSASPFGR